MTDTLAQVANGRQQFVNTSGVPLVGGTVATYVPGTLTPKTTYQDAGSVTPNANPLTLDALGSAVIWGSGYYRQIVKDALGNTVWDQECLAPSGTSTPSSTSSTQFFDSVASFSAATIPNTTDGVITTGYFSAGDGGGSLYKHSVGPAGPGKVQSADGQWWIVASVEPNVKMFGAKGDGVTDDSTAINNAVQYAITQTATKIFFPHATYSIASPILVFSWSAGAFTFFSLTLEGESPGYITGKQTAIVPTYKDKPALVIQACRNVLIKNLAILGLANNHSNPSYTQLLEDGTSPWWNTGNTRDSGFSPYAGIALDPFCSGLPSDGGYPGLNGTGGTNYYTANTASSGLFVDTCTIQGFIVGVAISISGGGTQQGDNVVIEKTNLSANKVCVAVGQSQDRGVTIRDPFVIGCQVFVDCKRYGTSTGAVPNTYGGVIDYVKWLVLSSSGGFGKGSFHSVYSESIFSLGVYTGFGAPLDFIDCEFKFISSVGNGVPVADVHFYSSGVVNFIGGQYIYFNSLPEPICFYNVGKLMFKGVTFNTVPVIQNLSLATAEDCNLRYAGGSFGLGADFYIDVASGHVATLAIQTGTQTKLFPGGKFVTGGGSTKQVWTETGGTFVTQIETSVAITNNGDGTGTFTSTNAGRYQTEMELTTLEAWLPWPEIASSFSILAANLLAIGQVSGVSGSTVSLKNVPWNFPTGTYTIYFRRLGSLRARAIATTTSGSPNISISPTNAFAAGDWIHSSKLSGIPMGTYVVSNSSGVIVLSQNATATRTNLDIQDCEYQIITTGVSAPASGTWFQGDYCVNFNPTVDGNGLTLKGWICTSTGIPGTWTPDYSKSTSP